MRPQAGSQVPEEDPVDGPEVLGSGQVDQAVGSEDPPVPTPDGYGVGGSVVAEVVVKHAHLHRDEGAGEEEKGHGEGEDGGVHLGGVPPGSLGTLGQGPGVG